MATVPTIPAVRTGTLSRGWNLAKACFEVLKKDKEIMLLPLISGIILILVGASFLWVWIVPVAAEILEMPFLNIIYIAGLFVFYLFSYFVIVFFNAAVIGCATIRFEGGDPKVSDGLQIAAKNFKNILVWAIIAATVGTVLKVISRKTSKSFIGNMISSALGLAWSVGTYFVVPVLIYEKVTPQAALKRSVEILRQTWGEALVTTLGIGTVFALLTLAALFIPIPVVIGLIILLGLHGTIVAVGIGIAAVFALVSIIVLACVNGALEGILVAALYRYGTKKEVSPGFSAEMLANPWE